MPCKIIIEKHIKDQISHDISSTSVGIRVAVRGFSKELNNKYGLKGAFRPWEYQTGVYRVAFNERFFPELVEKEYAKRYIAENALEKKLEKDYGKMPIAGGEIKPGVSELFDSTPELANAVYEALGFKKDLSYDTFKKVIGPKGYAWSILDGGKKITINSKEFNFTIATGDNIGQAIQWVIDNKGSKKELLSILEVFLKEYQNKSPENYKPLDFIINEAIEDGNFFQKLKDKSISLGNIAKNNAKRTFDDLLELYYEVHNSGDISKIKTDVKESSKKTGYEFLDDRLDYFSGLSQQQKQQAQQLYSQYLDTIFPDSQVKDIVYHGSIYDNKQKFEKSTRVSGNYFAVNPNEALQHAQRQLQNKDNAVLYSILLNIKNPKTITKPIDYDDLDTEVKIYKGDTVFGTNYDAIIAEKVEEYNATKSAETVWLEKQIVIFEPSQALILGSKQDIEGFKGFTQKDISTKEVEKLDADPITRQLSFPDHSFQNSKELTKDGKSTDQVQSQLYTEKFDEYFPDYTYLSQEEKDFFIQDLLGGNIKITCKI